jgi:hypothetical protein
MKEVEMRLQFLRTKRLRKIHHLPEINGEIELLFCPQARNSDTQLHLVNATTRLPSEETSRGYSLEKEFASSISLPQPRERICILNQFATLTIAYAWSITEAVAVLETPELLSIFHREICNIVPLDLSIRLCYLVAIYIHLVYFCSSLEFCDE